MRLAVALTPRASDHFRWIEEFYHQHKKTAVSIACYEIFISQWNGDLADIELARQRIQHFKSSNP
jgi:hypothetical protein